MSFASVFHSFEFKLFIISSQLLRVASPSHPFPTLEVPNLKRPRGIADFLLTETFPEVDASAMAAPAWRGSTIPTRAR